MTLEAEHQTLTLHAPDGSNTFKNSQHGCGKQTHRFTFSKIFKETTTQKEFFASTVLNTVKDFIEGQNCLIFTYGVTNSGKTYTIQGEHLHFITSYILIILTTGSYSGICSFVEMTYGHKLSH